MKISEIELLDIDDLYDLSNKIQQATLALEKAKQEQTTLLALITKKATQDSNLWVGGKQPSVAYIKEQYHVLGYDEDTYITLNKMREFIYTVEADKNKFEREFNLGLKLLDVWRTHEANKRRTINS